MCMSLSVCLPLSAGRSTDSESEVLSEEDYSVKVASESSLATNDKSGKRSLHVYYVLHVISVIFLPS